MVYPAGIVLGVVWLWFWLRGNWFAALLAALALGWFPLVDVQWRNEWQLCLACLVVPWLPMMLIPAVRRIMRDIKAIAGTDAEFAEPLSLQLRDPR